MQLPGVPQSQFHDGASHREPKTQSLIWLYCKGWLSKPSLASSSRRLHYKRMRTLRRPLQGRPLPLARIWALVISPIIENQPLRPLLPSSEKWPRRPSSLSISSRFLFIELRWGPGVLMHDRSSEIGIKSLLFRWLKDISLFRFLLKWRTAGGLVQNWSPEWTSSAADSTIGSSITPRFSNWLTPKLSVLDLDSKPEHPRSIKNLSWSNWTSFNQSKVESIHHTLN